MKDSKLTKKGKGFYYQMVENFQRLIHFSYLIWRIERIMATPTTEYFTVDEKTKLIEGILKELKELNKEKK